MANFFYEVSDSKYFRLLGCIRSLSHILSLSFFSFQRTLKKKIKTSLSLRAIPKQVAFGPQAIVYLDLEHSSLPGSLPSPHHWLEEIGSFVHTSAISFLMVFCFCFVLFYSYLYIFCRRGVRFINLIRFRFLCVCVCKNTPMMLCTSYYITWEDNCT